jgi:iron complex outermembrane receptor protein
MKTGRELKKRIFFNVFPRAVMLSFLASVLTPASSQGSDLELLTLDELLDLEVVSVARVPEKVIDTPAAIYIITGEDLRRSGVQTVPEALRMVPGLHVY